MYSAAHGIPRREKEKKGDALAATFEFFAGCAYAEVDRSAGKSAFEPPSAAAKRALSDAERESARLILIRNQ